MKLSKKQRDKLWGETGPYSQASLIFETRILDDKINRIFLNVEADINPLTYEIVKQNRNEFKGDEMIQQLLDHADNRGQEFGYVVSAFQEEYTGEEALAEAKIRLAYTEKTLIRMHKFVMDLLDIKTKS
ncbi:MAG: hypothetical protein WA063_00235 [Minisyncoccia bacterium]